MTAMLYYRSNGREHASSLLVHNGEQPPNAFETSPFEEHEVLICVEEGHPVVGVLEPLEALVEGFTLCWCVAAPRLQVHKP